MPSISILMSVFNNETEVGEAIESILEQTFTDFEFIIIDDASTDDSEQVIKTYAQQDARIQFVKNENNLKLAASLNKGIGIAKGGLIARMDADDVALPDRLQTQFTFMQDHGEVAVCGTWVELYEDSTIVWKNRTDPLEANCATFFESCFHHPTVMIRKIVLDDFGGYDESVEYAQDCHLWSRLAFDHQQILQNIGQVHLRYRSHPEKQRDQYRIEQHDRATELRKKNLSRIKLTPSKVQYRQHDILCCAKPIKSRGEFKNMMQWMKSLETANQQTQLLSEWAFKKEIDNKFLGVCLASASHTLYSIWFYLLHCKTRNALKNVYRCSRMFVTYVRCRLMQH